MKCEICKQGFEDEEGGIRWRTFVGLDYVCKRCGHQLVAEAAAAKPQPGRRCSRCEAVGPARQMECVDWLLCARCLETVEDCLEEPSSSGTTATFHLGSTAWKRTVQVRCLSGAETFEAEITVEKKPGCELKQESEPTVLDTYIVSIGGEIRGMMSVPEAETYDARVWGIHLADILKCDRVVAIGGSDFGQLSSAL